VNNLDFSDRPYLASRLARRALFELRAARRPATLAALTQLSEPAQQSRMVFIVGAARSGTTALQTALSTNPEVFLFGEANFFWENLRPRFRARYNAKHRMFGYPPSKLNDCPVVAPERATWSETLTALASDYRFVGDKISFGGYKEGRWPSEFLSFHRRYFHGAAYLLLFRNPRDTILSARSTFGIQNLVPWARAYIAAQRVLIRLRLHFPRTVPVFLETVDANTFQTIEHCLNYSLPLAPSVFRRMDESARDAQQVPPELSRVVNDLAAMYPALRDAVFQFDSSRSTSPFEAIDARLTGIYKRLDPLYYSFGARLDRLRSKVRTGARITMNSLRLRADR
jgi:hypothetical protein